MCEICYKNKLVLSYSGSWSGFHHGGQPGGRKEDRTG